MAGSTTPTLRQMEEARRSRFHQDGSALRTLDDQRLWLESAGLVPYYAHPQFATPAASFAEAILGRPENGWIPRTKAQPGSAAPDTVEDESLATEFGDIDTDADSDEDAQAGEELRGASVDPASDPEVMLSDDDEIAEDEGDEIAEEDRIRAGSDPLPDDLEHSPEAGSEAEELGAAERTGESEGGMAEDAPAGAPHAEVGTETSAQLDAAEGGPKVPPVAAPAPVNGFSAEERDTVRRALARLVEDGSAVPLNLLGSTTGEPDYICSAQAFSFVYTLRGDKLWKQEPAQTGSMRVSPLAVKVYALLKDKGAQAPHELAQELGQGIVDSAVLRALSELWAIQRVLPIPAEEGKPAKWETMSGRYMRHIKAGANAGQPTALSALLSLYLSQVIAATTEEMEIFLSPLVARSRVRDVVHGLSATKQLDPVVIDGRTLLHISGDLPDFPAEEAGEIPAAAQARSRYEVDDRRAASAERAARGPRPERGSRPERGRGGAPERRGTYPVRRPAGARDASARPSGDRERRPFSRSAEGSSQSAEGSAGSERNSFARPWDDDRQASRAASPEGTEVDRGSVQDRGGRPPRPPFGAARGGSRPVYGRPSREGSSDRGSFRPSGDDRRPSSPRSEGGYEARRPSPGRGTYPPRRESGERPARPAGDRPFAAREGGSTDARRPFFKRDSAGPNRVEGERSSYAPRSGGGDRRPYAPREGGSGGDRRPYTPREGGSGGDRRPFAPRGGGESRPFPPRDGERRPFVRREDGPREGARPARPYTPREGARPDRPYSPRDGARPARPYAPREASDRGPDAGRKPFRASPVGERRGFDGPRRPFSERNGSGGDRPRSDRPSGGAGLEGRPSGFSRGPKPPGASRFSNSGPAKGPGARFGKPGGFGGPRKSPGPGRGGPPRRSE